MTPTLSLNGCQVYVGNALNVLSELPDGSANCCVTSPPYWQLRSYLPDDHEHKTAELGQEDTPEQYVSSLVAVFQQVRRVLRDDGTLWLNLGSTYFGSGGAGGDYKDDGLREGQPKFRQNLTMKGKTRWKTKDLVPIPWMVALRLQALGWWLRQDIIWAKPAAMPEPVKDRCTRAHEYLLLLSKSRQYYFSRRAFENCNKRSVWRVNTARYPDAHYAVFPADLIRPCVLAGCPEGGTVLDPFIGSGTTAEVAQECNCLSLGIDIDDRNIPRIRRRIENDTLFSPKTTKTT